MTSTHAVAVVKRAVQGQEGRPCRHARSARVRHPADRARRSDQDGAVRDGRAQALPLHGALGRGARHRRRRRPRGRRRSDARPTADAIRALPAALHRRDRAGPAAILRDQGRRRARLRPRPRRRGGRARGPAGRDPRPRRWSRRPTPITPCSRPNAARAPMCGRWRAISGRALGCLGHVSALRRTAVGPVRRKRHDFAGTTGGFVP